MASAFLALLSDSLVLTQCVLPSACLWPEDLFNTYSY
jgi:hypothetical protein